MKREGARARRRKKETCGCADGGSEDGNATRWRRRNRDLKRFVPAGYGRMQKGGGEDMNLENHMYHKHS